MESLICNALSPADLLERLQRAGSAGSAVLEDVSPDWLTSFFAFKVLSTPRFNEWGRGTTVQAARIGALMERAERLSAYAAARQVEVFTLAPSRCDGRLITITDLGLCNFQRFESFDEMEPNEPNHFVKAARLRDSESVYAPASRVFLGYQAPLRDKSCSTGLAAHFDREEAIARGFLEVLERHIHHLIRFGGTEPGPAFDLEADEALTPAARRLVEQLRLAEFQITAAEVPFVDELYTMVVRLTHANDEYRHLPLGGRFHVAVHWDAPVALERALTECLLSRAVAKWHPGSHGRRRSRVKKMQPHDWSEPPFGGLSGLPLKPAVTTVKSVIRLATSLGVEPYSCDLTLSKLEIPVVRVLVPGLQPNFDLLGWGPLDPRARITPHLKLYGEWMSQVRSGRFEKHRTSVSLDELQKAATAPEREQLMKSPRIDGMRTSISLPPARTGLTTEREIARRRTIRRVTGAIALDELSTLLRSAVGSGSLTFVSPWGFLEHRNYPSAGGIHPLILIVEVRSCGDLKAGAYLYHHHSNQLSHLDLPSGSQPCRQTSQERSLDPALIVRMVRFGIRQKIKYGRAARRLSMIEAGHIGQNLLLVSAELGINAVPLGNTSPHLPVIFSPYEELGMEVIYTVAFGKPQ
jgi:SagB-type dehydrogenase family enzyme